MKINPNDFVIGDHDFDAALREIDDGMKQEGLPLAGRELNGWMRFCARFQLDPVPMNHPVSERVFRWFTEVYGEKLNLDTDVGFSVVQIRGELYKLRCTLFFGTIHVVCDPLLVGVNLGQRIVRNRPGQPRQTITDSLFEKIKGLTPTLAKNLSIEECRDLLNTFERTYVSLTRIKNCFDLVYAREAFADIQQSAEHLLKPNAEPGLANWAALQAVEKLLKTYISEKGRQTAPKTHDLAKLAAIAESLGLPTVPRIQLQVVQCDAGVRYDSQSKTKAEALVAHSAALAICGGVAEHLEHNDWVLSVRRVDYRLNGERPRPLEALMLSNLKRG